MIGYAYLTALILSLLGMGLVDHRWKLFLFRDAGAASIVLMAGVAYFLGWDHVGLAAGVFFRGDGPYQTGLEIAPHLPLEEAVFLLLLCYSSMVFVCAALRLVRRRDDARGPGA